MDLQVVGHDMLGHQAQVDVHVMLGHKAELAQMIDVTETPRIIHVSMESHATWRIRAAACSPARCRGPDCAASGGREVRSEGGSCGLVVAGLIAGPRVSYWIEEALLTFASSFFIGRRIPAV